METKLRSHANFGNKGAAGPSLKVGALTGIAEDICEKIDHSGYPLKALEGDSCLAVFLLVCGLLATGGIYPGPWHIHNGQQDRSEDTKKA